MPGTNKHAVQRSGGRGRLEGPGMDHIHRADGRALDGLTAASWSENGAELAMPAIDRLHRPFLRPARALATADRISETPARIALVPMRGGAHAMRPKLQAAAFPKHVAGVTRFPSGGCSDGDTGGAPCHGPCRRAAQVRLKSMRGHTRC
jgi:hypothetical protein